MIHSHERYICSINPIEAVLSGIIPALIGGSASASKPPEAPAAPGAPAPPASNPIGEAKKPMQQQSFIGAAATPNTQSGQKTLLGQ